MMFSPSQLLQSMTQRAPVSAVKPIELVPGQVFKGTVIKHYPNQMSLVQIGPIQVQAKMEANLEPGQKAWLQVQPSSDVVTLKVLDTPLEGNAKGGASLEGLMRSLGLPESKESRAIVQALLNANQPVSKETVQAFMGVAQKLGMDNATIQAFMTALKRNLPLTAETVAGLKAFFSDRPVSQVIQNFMQQAARFLEANGESARTTGSAIPGNPAPTAPGGQTPGQAMPTLIGDARQLVGQLRDKLAALPVLLGVEGMEADEQTATSQSSGNRQGAAGQNTQAMVQQPATTASAASGPQAAATAQVSSSSQPSSQITPNQMLAGDQRNGSVAREVLTDARQASTPPQSQQMAASPLDRKGIAPTMTTTAPSLGNVIPQPGQGTPVTADLKTAPQQVVLETGNQPQEALAQSQPSTSRNHPILQLFQQLGISHERELIGQMISGSSLEAGAHKQMESVKAMILQLTQNHAQAIPTALREAADQLLQQVTGQQLMLTQPANHSLSQIVMQIPLRTEQGDETAYVQIESKKKGAGQLDAENCRLFFHLDLQALGTTMIDVNIVNKIISLQIFNDTPGIEALAHAMKGGFTDQLHEVGYQLSSMRVQAIPKQHQKASAAKSALMSDYKGVDLRV